LIGGHNDQAPVVAEARVNDAFGECHFIESAQLVDVIKCESARFLFEADSAPIGRQCRFATKKPALIAPDPMKAYFKTTGICSSLPA
jgi:hypothetical protein